MKKGAYRTLDESGYSVFKETCYCCKKDNKCKLIDGKLVCKKCNRLDNYIDIILPDFDKINEDGTLK